MKKFLVILISLLVGFVGGGFGIVYTTLPETEELSLDEQSFYASANVQTYKSAEVTGEKDELSIHFLELGNKYTGDCTYIKYGDYDILIDCGSRTSSISAVTTYINQYMTDNTLEYVIVTHAHQDHYAGFATSTNVNGIFDLYECENIIDFGSATYQTGKSLYQKYVTKRDKELKVNGGTADYFPASDITLGNNLVFEIGEKLKLEVLYNSFNKTPSTNENLNSVCTLFTFDDTKHFLFTGDLEEEGEHKLVQNNTLPTVDVFKAGHHGSPTSSSDYLLSEIQPKTVCVCCCAGSSEYTTNIDNQFPSQQFINNVAKYTDQIFVTTMCVDYKKGIFIPFNGNIILIAKPSEDLKLNCSNNTIILRKSEWFNKKVIDANNVERQMRIWPEYGVISE